MNTVSRKVADLAGRILMAAIFLIARAGAWSVDARRAQRPAIGEPRRASS